MTLAANNPGYSVVQTRIQAVENGLLPSIIIQHRPAPVMRLTDRMAFYRVPGISIAVINNFAIDWAKGYGVASVSTGKEITTQTLFQAASISKPIAAVAALHLAETKRLPLDADVNDWLRNWKLPTSEYIRDQKVTLKRLLNHTAGLNVAGFPGYAVGARLPTLTQILKGETPANTRPILVETLPGTQWRYSGGGYVVLQRLIEDIAGLPFPDFMELEVLPRLEMQHSTFRQPLPRETARSAASGHSVNGQPITGGWLVYPEMAAAGLWTTPSDLAQFFISIQSTYAARSHRLLSEKMTQQMFTAGPNNWGLGIEVGHTEELTWIAHAGHNTGFTAYLFAYTAIGNGAVIMTNSDHGDELAQEIFRAIARVYDWPDWRPVEIKLAAVAPDIYDAYVGRYQPVDDQSSIITVSKEDNRIFVRIFGEKQEMYPQSENEFIILENGSKLSFYRDGLGGVELLTLTLPELPFMALIAYKLK